MSGYTQWLSPWGAPDLPWVLPGGGVDLCCARPGGLGFIHYHRKNELILTRAERGSGVWGGRPGPAGLRDSVRTLAFWLELWMTWEAAVYCWSFGFDLIPATHWQFSL